MAMVGRNVDRGRGGNIPIHGDVFPGLVAFVGAGMVLAAAAALVLAALGVGGAQSLRIQVYLIGAVGAILGLFVGLGRGVWRPGAALPAREPTREPPPQLWDPWLDSGREEEWTVPNAEAEEPVVPVIEIGVLPIERARVRPRVISPGTSEAVLLEDEIGPLIQNGASGLVQIVGGPGSGKSTALRHLAAILPPWMHERVQLLDDSELAVDDAGHSLIITTALEVPQSKRVAAYPLARWNQDDVIEYLLAAHRERCPSVMARLKQSGNCGFLRGIPELWTAVLDLMASDESIADIRSALRRELAARLGNHRLKEQVEELCLTAIPQVSQSGQHIPMTDLPLDELADVPFNRELFRLIRHQPVMLLMAADRLAYLAEQGHAHHAFTQQLPRELIREAAQRLTGNAQALQHLCDWIDQAHHRTLHPTVASLLHAVIPDWIPGPLCRPRLCGAYLDRVKWSGVNLARIDLQSADLELADLFGAHLECANARRACFCRADLRGANLTDLEAEGADFRGANLLCTTAKRAKFAQANVAEAVLIEADLSKGDLQGADIHDTDLSGANLEDACLKGLELKLARLERARFGGADLSSCNLEEVRLTAPDFHDADLRNALLTGSWMPRANFLGANLCNAGLADIDWPQANLRDADLRGASFHLGSSRSGLVGSPIACEGSRTGFYTDDYTDQNVKPAEEIRKANLRGADLRGADLTGVDFYLVDLRDAQYTSNQAEHFRCCRAILKDRVQ